MSVYGIFNGISYGISTGYLTGYLTGYRFLVTDYSAHGIFTFIRMLRVFSVIGDIYKGDFSRYSVIYSRGYAIL